MKDHDRYVPAAGRQAFTAFYDPAMAATMREHAWRPPLAKRVLAGLPKGGTVIDVGPGTGTFAIKLQPCDRISKSRESTATQRY